MSRTIILAERQVGAAVTNWKQLLVLLALSLVIVLGGMSSPLHRTMSRTVLAAPAARSVATGSLGLALSSITPQGDVDGGPPGI